MTWTSATESMMAEIEACRPVVIVFEPSIVILFEYAAPPDKANVPASSGVLP